MTYGRSFFAPPETPSGSGLWEGLFFDRRGEGKVGGSVPCHACRKEESPSLDISPESSSLDRLPSPYRPLRTFLPKYYVSLVETRLQMRHVDATFAGNLLIV